jgi:tetratricopeptide (TPR) repeat protein
LLSVPAVSQSSKVCVDTKDYVKAVEACSETIISRPNDAAAYHMRGTVLAKNGDTGQAIADYSRAIQLNPTYVPAYNSRAMAFVDKGDYTSAVADATKATELQSKKAQPVKAGLQPKKQQQAKASPPVRAKSKILSWASAKRKNTQEETPFNPFEDRASIRASMK